MPRLIRSALARARLGPDEVSSGVDVIGDIAVVRTPELSSRKKKLFGVALLEELKTVRAVFEQEGPVEGEFRLRKLRHLAGEKRTLTVHRENGCAFRVDVATCYFSPRLSTERLRVADATKPGELVLNMFAGVGPFSIPIARKGNVVTSCEVNPEAAKYHQENNSMNRVGDLVRVINEDAGQLASVLNERFDRVIMPHPSMADRFVDTALKLAKKRSTIHYYRHVLGENSDEAEQAMKAEVSELFPRRSKWEARKVRVVGPRWMEIVADVRPLG